MEESERAATSGEEGAKGRNNEDEAAKRARIREKIIREITDSERTYQHHLELVIQYFEGPLHDLNLVPDHVIVTIFSNIRQIVSVNQELVQHLTQIGVGQAFLRMGPFFKLYSTYANNHERALAAMIEWEQKRPEFGAWRRQQEELPEMMGLKLNSLLITPVQRIPRYKLLLEDLLQNTEKSHSDYSSIEEAGKQISLVASHINEHIRQHDNFNKMLAIQKSLAGPGAPRILTPGRIFIKDGPLKKVSKKGGRSHERMFFLFSDILLYAKPKFVDQVLSGSYVCCCVLPLHHCKVDTVFGHSQSSGSLFTITCKNESLLLYSDQKSVQSWVNILRKTIGELHDCRQTLRKPSSALQPLRRPGLVQLRKQEKKKDILAGAKRTPERVSHSPKSIKRALAETNINCLSTPRKHRKTSDLDKPSPLSLNSVFSSSEAEESISPQKGSAKKAKMPKFSLDAITGNRQRKMAKKLLTHIRHITGKERDNAVPETQGDGHIGYKFSPEPQKQGPECDIEEILDPQQPKWDIFDTALPDDNVVWRSRLDTDPPDMQKPVAPPRRTRSVTKMEDSNRSRPQSEISENTSRIWKARPESDISDFDDTSYYQYHEESDSAIPSRYANSDSDADSPIKSGNPPLSQGVRWTPSRSDGVARDRSSRTVYSHSSRDFLSKYAFEEDGSPRPLIYHKQSESMLMPYRTQWSTPSPPGHGRNPEGDSNHSAESEDQFISPEPDVIPESWRSLHTTDSPITPYSTTPSLGMIEEDSPVSSNIHTSRDLLTPIRQFREKYAADLSPWKVIDTTSEVADKVIHSPALLNGNAGCCIQ